MVNGHGKKGKNSTNYSKERRDDSLAPSIIPKTFLLVGIHKGIAQKTQVKIQELCVMTGLCLILKKF